MGFTLLEIMLVVSFVALIGVFVAPVTIERLQERRLRQISAELTDLLSQAQAQAMWQEYDSPHGVLLEPDRMVLFVGSSFDGRQKEFDQIRPLPRGLKISENYEIVFSPFYGNPSRYGEIFLELGSKRSILTITPLGNVSYQTL